MDYLVHHGVKGQKWGVRRYQNSDGTLTDEGRRRYGYGTGADSVITKNTKERAKQGLKLGTKIGTGVGAVSGGLSAASITSLGLSALEYGAVAPFGPAGIAAAAGGAFVASTLSGAFNGALYGTVIGAGVGAVETAKGRQYIENYDSGIDDFEARERRARRSATNVRLV